MVLEPTIARYDSRCAVCERLIHEGDDEIVFLPDDEEWVHVDCALDEGWEVQGR